MTRGSTRLHPTTRAWLAIATPAAGQPGAVPPPSPAGANPARGPRRQGQAAVRRRQIRRGDRHPGAALHRDRQPDLPAEHRPLLPAAAGLRPGHRQLRGVPAAGQERQQGRARRGPRLRARSGGAETRKRAATSPAPRRGRGPPGPAPSAAARRLPGPRRPRRRPRDAALAAGRAAPQPLPHAVCARPAGARADAIRGVPPSVARDAGGRSDAPRGRAGRWRAPCDGGMAVAGALAVGGGVVLASLLVQVQERREELPGHLLVRAGRPPRRWRSRNRIAAAPADRRGWSSGAAGVTVFLLNPARRSRPTGWR